MLRRFGRPSPSMAVALTALVVALGGTSYAAVALPKNSVGATQIRSKAVGNSELKNNSVTSAKVKNGTLQAADFKPGTLLKGDKGDKGDTGATGPQGATGNVGAATVRSTTATVDLADGTKASYNAFCPAGQQAIGGGGRGDDTTSEAAAVTSSRPALSEANTEPPADGQGFTGWRLTVYNPTGGVTTGLRPTVWVICVNAPS